MKPLLVEHNCDLAATVLDDSAQRRHALDAAPGDVSGLAGSGFRVSEGMADG